MNVVVLDTNLLDPGTVSATLANGKTVTYRDWNSNPALDPLGQTTAKCAGNPTPCFVSPFIVQNNQYSSVAAAHYDGILEIKKASRGSLHVNRELHLQQSHRHNHRL
jgi:hypothetical protein